VGLSDFWIYIECMHYSGAPRIGMSRSAHALEKRRKKDDIAKVDRVCSALFITAWCIVDTDN
jgi:hypothetical protein